MHSAFSRGGGWRHWSHNPPRNLRVLGSSKSIAPPAWHATGAGAASGADVAGRCRSGAMRVHLGLAENQHADLIFVGLLLVMNAVTSAGVRNLAVEGGMVRPYSARRGWTC